MIFLTAVWVIFVLVGKPKVPGFIGSVVALVLILLFLWFFILMLSMPRSAAVIGVAGGVEVTKRVQVGKL